MIKALLVSKGHPFDELAFAAFLRSIESVKFTHVQHPDAREYFSSPTVNEFDVFVFYDMPGMEFADGKVSYQAPTRKFRENFKALLQSGAGLVFLHHAIAGWPAWPEYAEIIGGRFLYQPTQQGDTVLSDSGYRHAVEHNVSFVDPSHPIAEGLPASFKMRDELYLIYESEQPITPLLTSDYEFVEQNFYSAANAVRGELNSNENWSHAKGSSLVGWTQQLDHSRVVYLQPGDAPSAYENEFYQKLVGNAIQWACAHNA